MSTTANIRQFTTAQRGLFGSTPPPPWRLQSFKGLVEHHKKRLGSKPAAIRFCVTNYPKEYAHYVEQTRAGEIIRF
jgi:hypothetical protein